MPKLARVEALIFESAPWKFVAVMCAIALVKSGVWIMPNLDTSRMIAEYPFVNPIREIESYYLIWNWLGPFLAWLIGVKSLIGFALFHLAFSVAFTALFVHSAFRLLPDRSARISIILFCALPASSTLYFWVGMDSITLFLMLVALSFPGRAIVTLVAGIGLGMQHFEQGTVGTVGLILMIAANRWFDPDSPASVRYPLRFGFVLLAGIVAGKLVLIGVFDRYRIPFDSGRIPWVLRHMLSMLQQFWIHWQLILWSVLGVGWLAAVRQAESGRRAIPFFGVLFGLILMLPVIEDQTRVIAIVTFPLLVAAWLLNDGFLSRISTADASRFALIWLVVPWSWAWRGIPRWSAFPYEVAVAVRSVIAPWFGIPTGPLGGPM